MPRKRRPAAAIDPGVWRDAKTPDPEALRNWRPPAGKSKRSQFRGGRSRSGWRRSDGRTPDMLGANPLGLNEPSQPHLVEMPLVILSPRLKEYR